jgi:hypothetical protein
MNREENRRMRSTIFVIRLLVLAGTSFFSSSLPVTSSITPALRRVRRWEPPLTVNQPFGFFQKDTTNLEDANLSIFGLVHFLELES